MVSNHSIKQQKPLSFRNHFYLIIRNYNYRNFAKVLSNKSPCGFSFTSLQHKFSNEIFFWFIGGDNQVLLNRSCIFYLLIAILLLIQCSNIRNNKASSTKTFLNCIPYSILRAIPHKERTAKRSGKRYNKEVKKQLTMSLISDELGQASTKKKEFLGIMEKLIPWSQWVGIVQPHYYKGKRGNKPYDLELMLRIYVLQHLYNLADDAARNEIIDSRAFSQFCGVDSSNQVPDGDTIGRFRHILERNQLGEAFFTNVVESLQKCNLMLKKGTIVDSTLIAAPSSTKNKEKQRDPEAHSVKKGNQWYFGYKEHIGVDADSGLVHTVETTSANVHDSNMVAELLQGTEEEIYGDSGYLGAEKRDDAVLVNNEGKPIRYQINKRPSQLKKANGEKFELLKAIEHAKSSVRSKVEHVFCVIKRIFHFCKTRYRGRKKLHQHCCTLFALANLYLARNRMKVA